MAKSNHSQRARLVLIEENTGLKRQNKSLEGNLMRWKMWYSPISKALNEGDNLRALALLKSANSPTGRRK